MYVSSFQDREVQSQWTGRQHFLLNTFAVCFVGNFVLFCCAGLVGQGLTRTLQMFYRATPSIKPCLNMLSRRTANHPILRAPGKKKLALKSRGDSHWVSVYEQCVWELKPQPEAEQSAGLSIAADAGALCPCSTDRGGGTGKWCAWAEAAVALGEGQLYAELISPAVAHLLLRTPVTGQETCLEHRGIPDGLHLLWSIKVYLMAPLAE